MDHPNPERNQEALHVIKLACDCFDAGLPFLLDVWVYDISLPPFGKPGAEELPDFWQLLLPANERFYATAARGQLINGRDIQIAIQSEPQGAWDRGGGHDQQ